MNFDVLTYGSDAINNDIVKMSSKSRASFCSGLNNYSDLWIHCLLWVLSTGVTFRLFFICVSNGQELFALHIFSANFSLKGRPKGWSKLFRKSHLWLRLSFFVVHSDCLLLLYAAVAGIKALAVIAWRVLFRRFHTVWKATRVHDLVIVFPPGGKFCWISRGGCPSSPLLNLCPFFRPLPVAEILYVTSLAEEVVMFQWRQRVLLLLYFDTFQGQFLALVFQCLLL